jgi:hypothetical protein
MHVISTAVILVLTFAFIVKFSLPYKSVGEALWLWIFSVECSWTANGLKTDFMINVTFKKWEILTYVTFSTPHDSEH